MRVLGFLLLAGTAAIPAQAQNAQTAPLTPEGVPTPSATDTPPPAAVPHTKAPPTPPSVEPVESDEPDTGEDIVVTGSRNLPGSVVGDIPAEQQLSPADIRSYGVSSVTELLNELTPQTTSGRGSGGGPVVLLNGRRISGFQEIRDLPTEAIQRVDILPEEVALKYGYRADQKVVNFVLRRRFRAVTAQVSDRHPTEGGRTQPEVDLDALRIRNNGRVNAHVEYTEAGRLTEAERDVRQPSGNVADGDYRTLLPRTSTISGNGTYATNVFGNVGATLNATVDHTVTNDWRGLPTLNGVALDGLGPLQQNVNSTDIHVGGALNGDKGRWRWSLTGALDRVDTDTVTQTGVIDATTRRPDNTGRSTSTTGEVDALASGPLFKLPAGDAFTSIKVGGATSDFTSRSFRNGISTPADIGRDTGSAQINLDLPITSRGNDVLAAIGNLSLNGNLAIDQLSDFGTLWTVGYGANWAPVDALRFLVSVTDQDEAPSAAQLGNPTITTPGVRVFDYVRGTTATIDSVTGGNPLLTADNRHAVKIGMDLRPWKSKDISFNAAYTSQRTDNAIASFPAASAALEAAFPTRFTRDEDGNLTRIDSRPVNFARTDQSQIRYGINLSFKLKSKVQKELEAFRAGTGPNPFEGMRPPGGGRPGGFGPGGDGPRGGGSGGGPGGGGFGRGGFGGGRGGGGAGGRLQFALYHTWHLTDRVLVAQGGPSLDLLNGDAIASSGGQARHELEGQAGYNNNGLGARLSVNFRSATEVNGGTAANPQTLDFDSLTTANLRLFADLGQRLEWAKAHPWMRGMRVTFSIDNLTNARQQVRDQTGAVPIGFQPAYLDPIGRTVRLSIRKLFF
jgi:hypothetical protein